MKHSGKKPYSILHITPHLGGGVGRVLLNYLEKAKGDHDFSHEVLSFEYANKNATLASKTTGFLLKDEMSYRPDEIIAAIADADIVLIHWWNHPLLYTFLIRETLPSSRIIFWSHVSGFHAPYVFNKPVLNYPDLFVFTSPLSLDTPEVKQLPDERRKALRVIWSTGGVENTAAVHPKPHTGFNVGYIGTVDYGKMHPHFLKMSSNVAMQDVHFIVCGGPSEKKLQEQAEQYGGAERFTFTGQINNINNYLEIFDVFGYPLAPYHYGTCEQSLCECMAAGIPPVVLANRTESLIVENGVTGIIATDEDTYTQAIERLYLNPDLRRQLSVNARNDARKKYSLELMVNRWQDIFNEALRFTKTPRQWTGSRQGKIVSGAHIFIESLGAYGKAFANSLTARNEKEEKEAIASIKKLYESSQLWRANTRGTANHYYFFFPDDNDLKAWSNLANIGHGNIT